MSENQNGRPYTAEEIAEHVAASPANYEQFVVSLTSPPETYNLKPQVLHTLIDSLRTVTAQAVLLDHLKRVITYGDKPRFPEVSQGFDPLHPEVLAAAANNKDGVPLTDRIKGRLLLIHALLGKMTEAFELAPVLLDLLTIGEFDEINCVEELGDDTFYSGLAEHALKLLGGEAQKQAFGNNLTIHELVRYRNGFKLGSRYKGGKFTAHEALNRDLGVEREALGGEASHV